MNIKQIRELALIVKQNELTSLEVMEGELQIRIGRDAPVYMEAVSAAATAPSVASPAAPPPDPGVDFNDVHEVKSPMVGVFYTAPAPDADPFVQVGQAVKKGDVLCIIEAMKLMNEITADRDGTIVDLCVHNGDVVEYGQALFTLF